MKWQTIDTAPKDGTAIIVFVPKQYYGGGGRVCLARWNDDKYARKPRPFWSRSLSDKTGDRASPPTHWMPLPEPPDTTNLNTRNEGE